MNKKELAINVSNEFMISGIKSLKIINYITALIAKEVKEDQTVKISGFGSFVPKNLKDKNGRNPRTGEKIVIPAYRAIKFRASSALKKEVKEG